MMIMMVIIILVLIGSSQLLFIFINTKDEAYMAKETYRFNVAKLKSEDINVFALGDKFPSKSVYRVDFRKGVI